MVDIKAGKKIEDRHISNQAQCTFENVLLSLKKIDGLIELLRADSRIPKRPYDMKKTANPGERRKHKRFKVYDEMLVFFDFYGEAIGQVTDISEGGIGFLYTGHKDWSAGLNTLDITTADSLFSITDIPVRAAWESSIVNEDSSISIGTKRCGIEFRYLTPDKKSQFMNFIEVQTSKAEYFKK